MTYVDRCKEHGEISVSYSQWELTMLQSSVPFKYWHTALRLELLLLKYVQSIRTGDLRLYISSISDVLPWCYILDHFHYAIWLAVHTRDMLALPERHPDLYEAFSNGYFFAKKSANPLDDWLRS